MIPYGKQSINQHDIDAVVEVLKSDYLTQGPLVPKFEESIANIVGAEYGVAVNSATSALHIACLALDVGPGDMVWTSPISFVATTNCALYCGADVEFIDIDKQTYNISISSLENKLKHHKENLIQLPKVVIAVHLAGQSCDMKEIHRLSGEYNFKVIEDASHAIGAKYNKRYVGNCDHSDICVFSFHPVKIITTAEGGMATTNQKSLNYKMKLLRSHGVTRDEALYQGESDGPWYYEQVELGYNYRMTELQAALGISQLERLHSIVRKRETIASTYDKKLNGLPIQLPYQHELSNSSWHLYIIYVEAKDHKALFEYLKLNEIGVNLHYIPIYKQPYYKTKYGEVKLDNAEDYYHSAISIPLFYDLSEHDQLIIIDCIKSYYDRL